MVLSNETYRSQTSWFFRSHHTYLWNQNGLQTLTVSPRSMRIIEACQENIWHEIIITHYQPLLLLCEEGSWPLMIDSTMKTNPEILSSWLLFLGIVPLVRIKAIVTIIELIVDRLIISSEEIMLYMLLQFYYSRESSILDIDGIKKGENCRSSISFGGPNWNS